MLSSLAGHAADADNMDFEGFLKLLRVSSMDSLHSLDAFESRHGHHAAGKQEPWLIACPVACLASAILAAAVSVTCVTFRMLGKTTSLGEATLAIAALIITDE